MKNSSSAEQRTRRALAGLGIVAASILLLAPVAGAGQPDHANGGRSETAPHGQPPAHPHGPEHQAEPEARSNQSETGAAAAEAKGDNRSSSGSSGAASDRSADRTAPRPNNGAATPESPGNSGPHKHTICHRTRSATNPYVVITVDFHAVDGEIVDSHGDHAERHDGPVFDPATMGNGDVWGDIIPPFTTPDGASYEGMNWTEAGRSIFDNGCEVPVGAPEVGGELEERDVRDGVLSDGEDLDTAAPLAGPGGAAADGPGAEVLDAEVLNVGSTLRDAVAVLGDQVTRNVAAAPDQVVPASASGPATIVSLARTGTGVAVLTMLGLALLAAGHLLVTGVRDRVGAAA
jgi:hypothetical protein